MKLPTWLKWTGVNLVFVLCHPALVGSFPAMPASAKSLVVNSVLFLLPAVGWSALVEPGTRLLGMRLFRSVVVSTCVMLCCLVALRLLGLTLTDQAGWNSIWLATNLGFIVSARARTSAVARRSLARREAIVGGVVFLVCYGAYYWGATRVVTAQLDHDLEVQATGFGLMNRFEPLLLTDRGGLYYFAHPPLLHVYVGASFLLHGKLADLQYYDDVSLGARERRNGNAAAPPEGVVSLYGVDGTFRVTSQQGADYLLAPEGGGGSIRATADRVDASRIIARYSERPYLIETRTPNLFFASATVALLAIWVGRLSHHWWLGLLVAAAYASSPEVFVRSSYGGYFAIGGFASIMLLLAADHWRRAGSSVLTGAFAALADHKLVFLPAVFAAQTAARWLGISRPRRLLALVNPKAAGFALGTVFFWLFGMVIAPAAFIEDHLGHHLLDRVIQHNPLGYAGYPSPLALWREFASHTAYILVPVACLLLVGDVVRSRVQPLARPARSRELWLFYVLITAVAFTVIDWRMTKHLVPILLPLHLALAPDRAAPNWRIAIPVMTALTILVYNAVVLVDLTRDFDRFPISPAW